MPKFPRMTADEFVIPWFDRRAVTRVIDYDFCVARVGLSRLNKSPSKRIVVDLFCEPGSQALSNFRNFPGLLPGESEDLEVLLRRIGESDSLGLSFATLDAWIYVGENGEEDTFGIPTATDFGEHELDLVGVDDIIFMPDRITGLLKACRPYLASRAGMYRGFTGDRLIIRNFQFNSYLPCLVMSMYAHYLGLDFGEVTAMHDMALERDRYLALTVNLERLQEMISFLDGL